MSRTGCQTFLFLLGLHSFCECTILWMVQALYGHVRLLFYVQKIMFTWSNLLCLFQPPLLQWSLRYGKGAVVHMSPLRLNILQSLYFCTLARCASHITKWKLTRWGMRDWLILGIMVSLWISHDKSYLNTMSTGQHNSLCSLQDPV